MLSCGRFVNFGWFTVNVVRQLNAPVWQQKYESKIFIIMRNYSISRFSLFTKAKSMADVRIVF